MSFFLFAFPGSLIQVQWFHCPEVFFMTGLFRLNIIPVLFCIGFLFISWSAVAQDSDVEITDDAEIGEVEEFDLTDEELDALLTRVDGYFFDQDMANLTVDIDIYRDPSNRLNEENIREGNPSRIAGLSTIVSHFDYEWPDFYQLKIMGQILAGSEMPADATFFSQILPLAGAPIYSEDLQERFHIRFEKLDDVDGTPTYKIRYSARNRDVEFFDYIVYYIGVEREVILRVESAFDNGWYVGTGQGNYYYDDWLGKYLPIYGHGSVLFYPNRRYNVWGKWYRWNWETPEEIEVDEVDESENDEVDESENDEVVDEVSDEIEIDEVVDEIEIDEEITDEEVIEEEAEINTVNENE